MEITRCETGTAGRLVLNLSATVLYRSSWQYEAWHCCVKWWHSGTATQTFLQQMACHKLSVHHNNGQQLVSPQLTKFTRRTTLWCKMTVAFSSLLMALLHISLLGTFPHYGCFLVSGVMLWAMFHNVPHPPIIHWRNCSLYCRCNISNACEKVQSEELCDHLWCSLAHCAHTFL